MVDEGDGIYYYLKDHMGTTRVLVREGGTVSARYYRKFALTQDMMAAADWFGQYQE